MVEICLVGRRKSAQAMTRLHVGQHRRVDGFGRHPAALATVDLTVEVEKPGANGDGERGRIEAGRTVRGRHGIQSGRHRGQPVEDGPADIEDEGPNRCDLKLQSGQASTSSIASTRSG